MKQAVLGKGGVRLAIKEQVLHFLWQHRQEDISGQQLAEALGVSRAAVWKAVEALRQEGFEVQAGTKRGYCLAQGPVKLWEQEIRAAFWPEYRHLPLTLYETVGSTNREAGKAAMEGAPQGSIFAADEQTCGRGQRGRSFFSPPYSGLYFSIILRPKAELSAITQVTMAAAVAVCRGVKLCTGKTLDIKWLNDLLLDGKKLCGILTQVDADLESGQVESLVVGIGLNLTRPSEGYPADLEQVAGYLFAPEEAPAASPSRLLGEISSQLLSAWENQDFLEEYRTRSLVLGKNIRCFQQGKWMEAKAETVDTQGRLVAVTGENCRLYLHPGRDRVEWPVGDNQKDGDL